MQVREFLAILAKRWVLIASCVLLVVAAAAIATLRITPVYESRTRVFLSSTAQGYVISRSDLGTYEELMRSPVVLDPIRAKLGLAPDTPLNISGSVADKAPILDVVVRSSNPATAKAVADEVGIQLQEIGGQYAPLIAAVGGKVTTTTLVPATLNTTPVSPNLTNNLLLGALVGLGLGVGTALLTRFLDTRIRTREDVAELTESPILANLPRLKSSSPGLVMTEDPRSTAAEEYRRLRTNLQFVDITTGGKHSFVVTSAMPSEGKTTTAANLARAFADSGARVLLVDGDLRTPSVAKTLGIEGAAGLTTVLLGRARLSDVVQPWQDSSLDVLPAGAIPPNPSELLGSQATRDLFATLLDDYDMVIVDSPPINPVIDSVLLGRLTGGLLLVVSANHARKREVAVALKSLETVDQAVVGVALNMLPSSETSYGGYYYGATGRKVKSAPAKPKRRRRPKANARRSTA